MTRCTVVIRTGNTSRGVRAIVRRARVPLVATAVLALCTAIGACGCARHTMNDEYYISGFRAHRGDFERLRDMAIEDHLGPPYGRGYEADAAIRHAVGPRRWREYERLMTACDVRFIGGWPGKDVRITIEPAPNGRRPIPAISAWPAKGLMFTTGVPRGEERMTLDDLQCSGTGAREAYRKIGDDWYVFFNCGPYLED